MLLALFTYILILRSKSHVISRWLRYRPLYVDLWFIHYFCLKAELINLEILNLTYSTLAISRIQAYHCFDLTFWTNSIAVRIASQFALNNRVFLISLLKGPSFLYIAYDVLFLIYSCLISSSSKVLWLFYMRWKLFHKIRIVFLLIWSYPLLRCCIETVYFLIKSMLLYIIIIIILMRSWLLNS